MGICVYETHFSSNSEKSSTSCFELLTDSLCDIQTLLPPKYLADTILPNKLLSAVGRSKLAYYKPADTVQGDIPDFDASHATMKKKPQSPAFILNLWPTLRTLVLLATHSKIIYRCEKQRSFWDRTLVFQSLRNKKKTTDLPKKWSICQSMASFQETIGSDNDEEQVA